MCYHPVKIKTVSPHGPRFSHVPCGKCEECRQTTKNAWSFRLCAEVEQCVKLGWHVGFCTLTVDDEHMSYLDKDFFKQPDLAPKNIRCFSKPSCQEYIKNIRKYLFREAHVTDIKYFLASELGAVTHRPHYHLLIAWPPFGHFRVKDSSGKYIREGRKEVRESRPLTADFIHDVCKRYWKLGFFMPRYASGGSGLEPFEVRNCGTFAAKYCAKYVCKDLQFDKVLNRLEREYEFTDDEEVFKLLASIQFPFHIQSRSLGLSFLRSCSDEQKYDLLIYGHHFAGDDVSKFVSIPLYFKNKIFFDPLYVVDEYGRRLVRRQATEFFKNNFVEIFERKAQFYEELLNQATHYDFWLSKNCKREQAFTLSNTVSQLIGTFGEFVTTRQLAEDYLAYYAVDYEQCADVDRALKWFSRYTDYFVDCDGVVHDLPVSNIFDFAVCDNIEPWYWDSLNDFWYTFFHCLESTNGWMQHDELGDYIRDFYANREVNREVKYVV